MKPRIAPPSGPGPRYGTELDRAMSAFETAAVRARAVDPVITEVVRLRCARHHDCRRCSSLRTEEAVEHGFDEALAAKIDDYEASDLPERAKAALRFTDAIIIDPRAAGPELRAAMREHFSDEQIAELAFDVVKWSVQKVLVALRLEAPPSDGLSLLRFDADGRWKIEALSSRA